MEQKKFINSTIDKMIELYDDHEFELHMAASYVVAFVMMTKWGFKQYGKAITRGVEKGIENSTLYVMVSEVDDPRKRSKKRKHR